MLYSARHGIGLARFPKTASTSLTAWFLETFPDAKAADPHDAHVPVQTALRRFGLVEPPPPPKWHRVIPRTIRPRPATVRVPKSLTVIGVVREPFEMLVSLYSFWKRRSAAKPRRPGSLPATAAQGTFQDFVVHAVIEEKLPTYRTFFGVGLPEQPTLELIDFRSIKVGLEAVCHRHRLPEPATLPLVNAAPVSHDYERFRDDVRFMLPAIHARYRWYYEEASKKLAAAQGPLTLRPAA